MPNTRILTILPSVANVLEWGYVNYDLNPMHIKSHFIFGVRSLFTLCHAETGCKSFGRRFKLFALSKQLIWLWTLGKKYNYQVMRGSRGAPPRATWRLLNCGCCARGSHNFCVAVTAATTEGKRRIAERNSVCCRWLVWRGATR